MRAFLFVVSLWAAACAARAEEAGAAAAPSPFADWSVAIVAADWRATNGRPTEAFDNARRDLVEAFVAAGFARDGVAQFSLKPRQAGDDPNVYVDPSEAIRRYLDHARARPGGCLFYVTTHGTPQGIVFGGPNLPPRGLARLMTDACGDRPTIVVVSACFSGVFVPALAADNRMVMTAARPDRSSFGCSETDRYPYFDACVLESLPLVDNFLALGRRVKTCVAERERAANLTPPSEPQTATGAQMLALLPMMPFQRR